MGRAGEPGTLQETASEKSIEDSGGEGEAVNVGSGEERGDDFDKFKRDIENY